MEELNTLLTKQDDQEKQANDSPSPDIIKTNSDDLEDDQEKHEKDAIFLPSLKIIKTKFENCEDDTEDGFKTPTSLEQRIPVVPLTCPPAPRKPKSMALTNGKAGIKFEFNCKRKIMFDEVIVDEVESLFPNSLVEDDFGDIRSKKIRNKYCFKLPR